MLSGDNGVLLAAKYESQSRGIYKINKHWGRGDIYYSAGNSDLEQWSIPVSLIVIEIK